MLNVDSKKTFPAGFLWGASISSHQVEGDNINDWRVWEGAKAQYLASTSEATYAHIVPDWPTIASEAQDPGNYLSGQATGHYRHYKQDIALAAKLGLTSFRLSLEWSRIQPQADKIDLHAIEHYRHVLKEIKKHGMQPFVTLWHWTLPLWVSDRGGWTHDATINHFAEYTRIVMEHLGGEAEFWLTLNEPEVYTDYSHWEGDWPPGGTSFRQAFGVINRLAKAHKKAFKIIKQLRPSAQVGIAKHNISLATDRRLLNIALKFLLDQFWNLYFLQLIQGYQDYIGLNYYFHSRTVLSLRPMPDVKYSDMGWELNSQGLLQVLKSLRRYKLPIYITENGLADARDLHRGQYIHDILSVVLVAIDSGIDIRGYSHWSLTDNFEWDKGFWPRFGLIAIDYNTLSRTVRPSALYYAEIIAQNALD